MVCGIQATLWVAHSETQLHQANGAGIYRSIPGPAVYGASVPGLEESADLNA